MSKGKIIKELKKHRRTMPRQTLKTIRGQAIAGDILGARKGLDREVKRLKDEDCFAYKNGKCTALKVKDCEACNFYKTKEQSKIDREKAMKRILSLDKGVVELINETYYKGKLEV